MWVGTRQTVGVARGFGEGVAGAVGGVVELAGVVGSCVDPVTRIIDRGAQDRCTEFVGGLVGLGAAFVENPKETTYYLFLEPIYTDWQAGNYGEAIGGSLFVAVEIVVGAKGAASGARAATAAIRSTRVAQSAGRGVRATSNFLRDLARSPVDEVVGAGAPTANRQVIVDTNAVLNRPGVEGVLRPGEVPVITATTQAELNSLVGRGRIKMPGFADELSVIEDVMDIHTRINIRGQLEAMRPGQSGLFGDGSIGTTAIRTGSPIITADKSFAQLMLRLGVEVRLL